MNFIKTVSAMDELDVMRSQISSFGFETCSLGSQGFTRLQIQLFGFLGHGKSSFINTCKYAWEDKLFVNYTDAKFSIGRGGDTKSRFSYPLTGNITLVDNRGCAFMNDYETGEIYAQLGNLLPFDVSVEWNEGFGLVDRIIQAEDQISKSDFVFPVFVYSVTFNPNEDECDAMRELLANAQKLTGIFPIVVLTHKTRGNLAEMESLFRGMGAERIFAFENYTPQNHLRTRGKHEDVLKFLLEVIRDVQFRMSHSRDPISEAKERKQFVCGFVYSREIKKKEQEMETQNKLNEVKARQERERFIRAQEEHEREIQQQKDMARRQEVAHQQQLAQMSEINNKAGKKKTPKDKCHSQ